MKCETEKWFDLKITLVFGFKDRRQSEGANFGVFPKKGKYHFGALTVRDFLAFYKVSFKPHEKASS